MLARAAVMPAAYGLGVRRFADKVASVGGVSVTLKSGEKLMTNTTTGIKKKEKKGKETEAEVSRHVFSLPPPAAAQPLTRSFPVWMDGWL